jgi:hypothetical protein
MANVKLSDMKTSYASLGRAHKRMAYDIGYAKKLNLLNDAINTNGRVTSAIADLVDPGSLDSPDPDSADFGRVVEALKHFVRDWSEEGREERERIFSPILNVLREQPKGKVLVPGAGLCRLAWEISQLGHQTTANELSYFMNLAFEFLLKRTSTPNEHTVHPYVHWFSHQRSNATLFRPVKFPDVVPSSNETLCFFHGDFFSIPTEDKFDYVVTLFFIDTSLNIISTLEQIHALLRPGGLWINLGPLLWTSGGQAQLELNLEEVLRLSEKIGFRIFERTADPTTAPKTIPCEYTSDKSAMMKWIYQAEFWVAQKVCH